MIDDLVEAEESSFASQTRISVNLTLVLQQDVDSHNLSPISSNRFDGNPSKWPEFIEKFFAKFHSKQTFDDNARMIRLDEEEKRTVEAIGCNKTFYATTLKILERDFNSPSIVAHGRLSSVLDKRQIKVNDKISLSQFHQ